MMDDLGIDLSDGELAEVLDLEHADIERPPALWERKGYDGVVDELDGDLAKVRELFAGVLFQRRSNSR